MLQNQGVIASPHSLKSRFTSTNTWHTKQHLSSALTETNDSFPHLCSSGGSWSAVDKHKVVNPCPATQPREAMGAPWSFASGFPVHGMAVPGPSSLVAQLCLSKAGESEPGHQPVAAAGREPKCLQTLRNQVRATKLLLEKNLHGLFCPFEHRKPYSSAKQKANLNRCGKLGPEAVSAVFNRLLAEQWVWSAMPGSLMA